MNKNQYYRVSGGRYKVLVNPTLKETEQSKTITFTIKGGDRNDFEKHKEYTVIITADRKDGEKHNIKPQVNNNERIPTEANMEIFKKIYLQLVGALQNKEKEDCTKMLAMQIFCLLTNLDIDTLKKQDTNIISQKSFIQTQQTNQSPAPEPNFFERLFTCYWCRNNDEEKIVSKSDINNTNNINKDN